MKIILTQKRFSGIRQTTAKRRKAAEKLNFPPLFSMFLSPPKEKH